MNRSTTIVLFVLCVLASGLFVLSESGLTFFYEPDPDQVFGRYAPRAFEAIEISRGDQRIRVERSDARWRLTAPFEFPASTSVIEEAIEAVRSIRVRSGLEESDVDRGYASTGLVLSFTVRGETERLEFGQDFPGLEPPACYLRVGSQTYLIDRRFREAFGAVGAFELQETRAFPVERDEVVRVRAESAGGRLELLRTEQGWQLVEPFVAAASDEAVNRLLEELTAARVNEFVRLGDRTPTADERATWQLAGDAPTLEISTDRESYRVRFGRRTADEDRGEEVYLEQEPTDWVGRIPARLLDLVASDFGRFVATRTLDVPIDRLTELEVRSARRSTVDWKTGDYAKLRLDDARTRVPVDRDAWLERLERLASTAVAFEAGSATEPGYGLGSPRVEFAWSVDGEMVTLSVGANVPDAAVGTCYVARSDWPGRVGRARVPDLDEWSRQPYSLRTSGLFTAYSPLRELELWNASTGARAFVRPGDEWRVRDDGGVREEPVDPVWADLLARLESAEVAEWRDPQLLSSESRSVFLTLTIPALPPRIPELVVMGVGPPDASGESYAWFIGQPWAFRLTREDAEIWRDLVRALAR